MGEPHPGENKLPLPKWCFVLLAIPTFCMPVAGIAAAFWALGTFFFQPEGRRSGSSKLTWKPTS